MTDFYTYASLGLLNFQTNHRENRIVLDGRVLTIDGASHASKIIGQWQSMAKSEAVRFSTMNVMSRQLEVPYEFIHSAFYRSLNGEGTSMNDIRDLVQSRPSNAAYDRSMGLPDTCA